MIVAGALILIIGLVWVLYSAHYSQGSPEPFIEFISVSPIGWILIVVGIGLMVLYW